MSLADRRAVGAVAPTGTRLTKWSIRNFKSVRRAEVALHPLTVLVGGNSAGKSSLIQSMLLFRQAQGDRQEPEDAVALNGSWVRLGAFSDVLSAACDPSRDLVSIGGSAAEPRGGPTYSWVTGFGSPGRSGSGRMRVTTIEISVTDPAAGIDGVARLKRRPSPLRFDEPVPVFLSAHRREARTALLEGAPLAHYSGVVETGRGGARVSRRVTAGTPNKGLIAAVLERQRLSRAAFSTDLAGMPDPGGAGEQRAARDAMRAIRAIRAEDGVPRSPATPDDIADAVAGDIAEAVRLYRRECADLSVRSGPDASNRALSLVRSVSDAVREVMIGLLVDLDERDGVRRRVARLLRRTDHGDATVLSDIESAEPLYAASDSIAELLGNRLRYLGPLRTTPRGLQRDYDEADGVGAEGEFTASVLHARGSKPVQYCKKDSGTLVEEPLGEAVAYWMGAMGLVDDVSSRDQDRYGLEVQVTPGGLDRAVDLRNVGVGISQVLPVVVLGLSSPPGSVILMEQPELHLHPLGQQALADFLIALMRSGRQLILETHSDHLVSRLRRRVAEDQGDDLVRDIGFLFAERSVRTGATTYREVVPNALGGLDDWPTGFMDQGPRESAVIVAAALRKQGRPLRDDA